MQSNPCSHPTSYIQRPGHLCKKRERQVQESRYIWETLVCLPQISALITHGVYTLHSRVPLGLFFTSAGLILKGRRPKTETSAREANLLGGFALYSSLRYLKKDTRETEHKTPRLLRNREACFLFSSSTWENPMDIYLPLFLSLSSLSLSLLFHREIWRDRKDNDREMPPSAFFSSYPAYIGSSTRSRFLVSWLSEGQGKKDSRVDVSSSLLLLPRFLLLRQDAVLL